MTSSKSAVTWLEIAWFLLLVLGSLAILQRIEAVVETSMKAQTLGERRFQKESQVPSLKALLEREGAELAAVTAAIAKERIGLERLRKKSEAFLLFYPGMVNPGTPLLDVEGPEAVTRSWAEHQLELETQESFLDRLQEDWKVRARRVRLRSGMLAEAEAATSKAWQRAQTSWQHEVRRQSIVFGVPSVALLWVAVLSILWSKWNRHARRVRPAAVFQPAVILVVLLVGLREITGFESILVLIVAALFLTFFMRRETVLSRDLERS